MRLKDKVAIVTGGSVGIGAAIAKRYAAEGATVATVYKSNDDGASAIIKEITDAGGKGKAFKADVSKVANIEKLIADVIAEFGRVDILVNNAGWNRPQDALDVDDDTFSVMVDLNLRAVFVAAQAAARRMADAGGGSIINMSSQMGHVGGPLRSVYCMTKWGVEGMSRAMAVDLASRNVRVNTVAPTFVSTPLADKFLEDPDFKSFVLDSIPLGRLATVEEVAAAVVYLASPGAASVTGTSILVDGGWTAK